MAFDPSKVDLSSLSQVSSGEDLDSDFNLGNNNLDFTMSEAIKVNPVSHAKNLNLSEQSGVPSFIVESNPDQVEQDLKKNQFDFSDVGERSPKTADYLTNIDNAIVAQEDISVLQSIEEGLTSVKEYATDIGESFETGQLAVEASDIGLSRMYQSLGANESVSDEKIARLKEIEELTKQGADEYGFFAGAPLAASEQLPIMYEILRTGLGYAVVGAVPGAAVGALVGGLGAVPGALVGAKVGGRVGIAKAAFDLEAGLSYNEFSAFKDENDELLNPQIAGGAAAIVGAVNAGLEFISLAALGRTVTPVMRSLIKNKVKQSLATETGREVISRLMKSYGIAVATETVTESAQEFVNVIGGELAKYIDKESFTEQDLSAALDNIFSIETGERVIEAGVKGAQASLIFAGVGTSASAVIESKQRERLSESEQLRIDTLNENVKNVKMREHSKESFRKFVEQADGDNNTTVFIDGVQTSLYLQEFTPEEIKANPALKKLSEQSREAAALGGDVQITVADFATDIAGTEHYDTLRDSMTLSGESTSPFRQEQVQQENESYVQNLMEEAQQNTSEYVEAQEIYTQVRDQLVDTGQVTAANASVMAQIVPAWATAKAIRQGKTVQQVYADSGLMIEGPLTGKRTRLEGILKQEPVTFEQVDEFSKGLEEELGLKTLLMSPDDKGGLRLTSIIVDKADRKKGTTAMQRITEYADQNNLRLTLTPAEKDDFQGVTSRARLVKFYKRFGFVENKGRNKDFTISESMYRPAQQVELLAKPQAIKGNLNESGEYTETVGGLQPSPEVRDQATITGRETIKQVDVGFEELDNPSKLARATISLSKSPQEKFWAITLDKNNKPLAILNHTLGVKDSASVDPAAVAGWALSVEGATQVWFSHNHPSGDAKLSSNDFAVSGRLANLLDGSGVESKGIMAVTPDEYTHENMGVGAQGAAIAISETENTIDLVERTLEKIPPRDTQKIESPADAALIVDRFSNGDQGVLLLSNKHTPVGFLPFDFEKHGGQLRGGKLATLLKAVESTNASAVILNTNQYSNNEINVANMLSAADMRVLDAFAAGKSIAETGAPITTGRTFKQATGEQPQARGYYNPANSIIRLTESSDLSTFLHEFAHFMYEMEVSGDTGILQSINNWYKRNAEDVAKEANSYLGDKFDALKQDSIDDITETKEFKIWFGSSVIVDGNGDPLVVYHGTSSDFKSFDITKLGSESNHPTAHLGVFFTDSRGLAEFFAEDSGGENIISAFVKMENPYEMTSSEFQSIAETGKPDLDGLIDSINSDFDDSGYFLDELYPTSDIEDIRIMKIVEADAPLLININKLPDHLIESLINFTEQVEQFEQFDHREIFGDVDLINKMTSLREGLIREGHDGVIITNDGLSGWVELEDTNYIIFNPHNIKSIENKGAFDPSDPDIFAQPTKPPNTKEGSITPEDVTAYLDNETTGDSDKDSAIRRAVHEQFARGFETYLMEGKAPSIELRNVFRTFARWLSQIYQALRGQLRVDLDKEMREVFDRLLATEEQIQAAEIRAKVEPMFTDAAMAGMTEEEFADYQKQQGKVKDVQSETLRDKLIKQLTRQTKSWWKEEKQDIIDEEIDSLKTQQVYLARERLKTGDLKIDHATVKETMGEKRTDKRGRTSIIIPPKLVGLTAKGQAGVHPDEAAAFFGYNSGSEMMNDLINAPPIRDKAESNAEAKMIERHGDIFTDGTIEREADEAVQSEERGKLILRELKALAKGTTVPTIDRATIKELAATNIGKLSFRQIHPDKYRRAEIRAAQEASRMLAEGNREGATAAKMRQVMNYYLSIAATNAKNETTKIVDRMSRYNKKKVREEIQKAEGGYWDQITKILNRFEFRKTATLKEVENINTWAKEHIEVEGDGLVLSNAVLNESYITHWKNVPFSELQGINDSVKNIEHVARYANKLTRMGEQIEFKKLVDQWVTSMNEKVKTRFVSKRTDVAEGRNWGRWFMSQMTKIPFMASWLDGGERVGISHQIMVQPMTDAYNAELQLWKKSAKPVMDTIVGRSKEDRKRHNRKIYIPEIDDNLYGHQIIAAALNTGNQSNLKKLLLGERWADPEVEAEITFDNSKLQAVLSHMTKTDWELVQKIWDQMETLYPDLAEVHRRTTGLTPPKIESTPVVTEFGTFRGGYYPVKYDPYRDFRAALNEDKLNAETESMFSNSASIQASVNTGATNERTGYYAPIRLSLDVVSAHFQETIHYITHHDPVREINRLTRNKSVAETIKEKLGPEEYAQLRPWLNDIAKDGREAPVKMFWDDMLQRLRFGVTLGAMGFKVSTGLIQISGLFNTMSEVGAKKTFHGVTGSVGQSRLLNAVRRTLGSTTDMQSSWEFAVANSQVLNHRVQTMDREIKNAMKHIEGNRGLLAAVQETSMKHIALIQTYMVDLPSWHAAYAKGLEQWGDEARAFQYADWVIENVQGSGTTKDLAKIMRGQSETGRMFTMFMTFFSSLWNMERDLVKGAKTGLYSTTSVAAKAMFLFTLPVLFEMLMRDKLDEPEDDDDRLQKILTATAMYPVQSVPFVRDVANAVTGDFGYNISPLQSIIEQGTRTIPEIITRGFTDEEITRGQIKGATKFIGAALGVPGTGQAWATGEHLHDVLEDGEEFTVHQLLFGPKRE